MKYLERELSDNILNKLQPNKVFMVYGARRVGKTLLVKNILRQIKEPVLILNGEDINVHDKLTIRSVENYKQIIGTNKLVYIDEAQKIPDIGLKLKLMIDEIPELKIITGFSKAKLPIPDFKNTMGGILVNIYRKKNNSNEGVNEGVNELFDLIKSHPGKRTPFFADKLSTSVKNIERWIQILKKTDKIEFIGSSKKGGYYAK